MMLNTNPNKLLYQYYTEKFDNRVHSPFLTEHDFYQFIGLFCSPNILLEGLIKKYNAKFGISELRDKEGKLIKLV